MVSWLRLCGGSTACVVVFSGSNRSHFGSSASFVRFSLLGLMSVAAPWPSGGRCSFKCQHGADVSMFIVSEMVMWLFSGV